jgi:hypothetical protein
LRESSPELVQDLGAASLVRIANPVQYGGD